MDAVMFLKELERMCKNSGGCTLCTWGKERSWIGTCTDDIHNEPEKAVAVVEKWSKENPPKTMKDDFYEKFPNAPKEYNGTPRCCPYDCGYVEHETCQFLDDDEDDDTSCVRCWSRPFEEAK